MFRSLCSSKASFYILHCASEHIEHRILDTSYKYNSRREHYRKFWFGISHHNRRKGYFYHQSYTQLCLHLRSFCEWCMSHHLWCNSMNLPGKARHKSRIYSRIYSPNTFLITRSICTLCHPKLFYIKVHYAPHNCWTGPGIHRACWTCTLGFLSNIQNRIEWTLEAHRRC